MITREEIEAFEKAMQEAPEPSDEEIETVKKLFK